jgi:hypothetical protein
MEAAVGQPSIEADHQETAYEPQFLPQYSEDRICVSQNQIHMALT